jgi:cytochrome c
LVSDIAFSGQVETGWPQENAALRNRIAVSKARASKPGPLMTARLLVAASLLAALSCSGGDNAPQREASLGEKRFADDCSLCHIAAAPDSKLAKLPRPGPNLWGVYGRASAQADFAYSKAMRNANLIWDEPTLHSYLQNPKGLVPGTQMAFAGEKDTAKRQAVIDYLKTLR